MADQNARLPDETMLQELREMRARHLELIKRAGINERNQAMLRLRKAGCGFSEIGDLFQISRDRVRVVIRMTEGSDA